MYLKPLLFGVCECGRCVCLAICLLFCCCLLLVAATAPLLVLFVWRASTSQPPVLFSRCCRRHENIRRIDTLRLFQQSKYHGVELCWSAAVEIRGNEIIGSRSVERPFQDERQNLVAPQRQFKPIVAGCDFYTGPEKKWHLAALHRIEELVI